MSRSTRSWTVVLCAAATLIVLSCSNSDDAVNVPVDQAVEAGLNSALDTTVVPVVQFMGAITNLMTVSATRAVGGASCPDTSTWCASGTVSCSVGTSGLDFVFSSCQLVTGDAPITVGGNVTAVPGSSNVYLTLTNLVIDGNTAMSGTGAIDILACDYTVNISAGDTYVYGSVVLCPTDDFPTGNTLVVTFGSYMVTITLNGSSSAPAVATQDGTPVAYCTIDLSADPLTSSCDVP